MEYLYDCDTSDDEALTSIKPCELKLENIPVDVKHCIGLITAKYFNHPYRTHGTTVNTKSLINDPVKLNDIKREALIIKVIRLVYEDEIRKLTKDSANKSRNKIYDFDELHVWFEVQKVDTYIQISCESLRLYKRILCQHKITILNKLEDEYYRRNTITYIHSLQVSIKPYIPLSEIKLLTYNILIVTNLLRERKLPLHIFKNNLSIWLDDTKVRIKFDFL